MNYLNYRLTIYQHRFMAIWISTWDIDLLTFYSRCWLAHMWNTRSSLFSWVSLVNIECWRDPVKINVHSLWRCEALLTYLFVDSCFRCRQPWRNTFVTGSCLGTWGQERSWSTTRVRGSGRHTRIISMVSIQRGTFMLFWKVEKLYLFYLFHLVMYLFKTRGSPLFCLNSWNKTDTSIVSGWTRKMMCYQFSNYQYKNW